MQVVGFIGAGKVACAVGRYFRDSGIPLSGYYDTKQESADEAATFTHSTAYGSMEAVVEKSDIIFIATPDDVISSVWESLKILDIDGMVVGIFSGSLSSDLFSGIDRTGASGASVHPMYAFSDRNSDYLELHTARFTIEGDARATGVFTELLEGLGHSVTVIGTADKVRYHAAASVASNMMVGLYDMSLSMLEDCGFSREGAVELVKPLIQKNISAMLSTSPKEALTGPIERGDIQTVKKHLDVLTDEERAVYVPLARRLVRIAEDKNPDRSYEELLKIL